MCQGMLPAGSDPRSSIHALSKIEWGTLSLWSDHSSLLVSSSSSSAAAFLAGFFFFFLFFPLAPVDFDNGLSRMDRISSSVIFLSVSNLETSSEGGAANRMRPFFVMAAMLSVRYQRLGQYAFTYGCEKSSHRCRVLIRDNLVLP